MADVKHSAHGKKDWTFDYTDITKATGLSYDVIVQHVHRKKVCRWCHVFFDPPRQAVRS